MESLTEREMLVLRFLVSQGTAYCRMMGMPIDDIVFQAIVRQNEKYITDELCKDLTPDEVYNLFLKLFP